MKIFRLTMSAVAILAFAPKLADAGPLLGAGLQAETVFSNTYTTTGANSKVYGNVRAGGVSTTGANANVYGNLVSVGAATTGGAGSTVSGNIASGGVLTTGAGSLIGGNITSSGASTVGANSRIGGNMVSDGAATTGDTSVVSGSIQTGGAASIGANATVVGIVGAVGAISVSASATVGGQQTLTASPINPTAFTASINSVVQADAAEVATAQNALTGMGAGTALAATMTVDTTLRAGVYSAASFSTTAGTTLTLDGQGLDNQSWVFNITDILATGASSIMRMINLGANDTVVWNSGNGYVSVGASSVFLGTILARTYVSVGAGARVSGVNNRCGGVYSQTSYVSTGDGAIIGGVGCVNDGTGLSIGMDGVAYQSVLTSAASATSVPEPATWGLLVLGSLLTVVATRRVRLRRDSILHSVAT